MRDYCFGLCYFNGMKRTRIHVYLEKEVLECAKKRIKDTNRKSRNNYIETLIIEDCKKHGV